MPKKDELLKKIHSTGYWRINIRPTVFDSERLPNLKVCKETILKSKVSLRGWDYPHVAREGMLNGESWIESRTDWDQYVEYWRFFQSAQFIHHFACREDYYFETGPFLHVLTTLFTLTEVFEFAGRLSEKQLLSPGAEISIQLNGMEGRTLYMPPSRFWFREYKSGVDRITYERQVSEDELLTARTEMALKAAVHVFQSFNWDDPSKDILAEDQRKLLERRV